MNRRAVGIQILYHHPTYTSFMKPVLERSDIQLADTFDHGVAQIVLDYPLTWAITQLEKMDSIARARTLVATQTSQPIYQDCLASFHLSGVVNSTNENALLSAIYAAASAQKTYQWQSRLTYMELRVTRLLLQGLDTKRLAKQLQISYKTVNAHISNILGKLDLESRAQYLAALLNPLNS